MSKAIFTRRSDLASECAEMVYGSTVPDNDGIVTSTEICGGLSCSTVIIKSQKGAEKIGKPIGRYVTVEIGKTWSCTKERLLQICDVCAEKISGLLPSGKSCLLAALGNRHITADSQGPLCAESFLVTRHIKQSNPQLFKALELFETSCIVPDVLGNTGVEAASTVKGLVEKIRPDFVIAVDSLAARRVSRVATTLQICDAGISPGSGVGNHRAALNSETLGVPVIAIGIPTVVDAATLGADILEECFKKSGGIPEEIDSGALKAILSSGSFGYFLTPKEADKLSEYAGKVIAMSINKALNPGVEYGEMEELVGR